MQEKLIRNILLLFPITLITFFPFKNLLFGFSISDILVVVMLSILTIKFLKREIKFSKVDFILILIAFTAFISFILTVKEWSNVKYTIRLFEYIIIGIFYFHFMKNEIAKNLMIYIFISASILILYGLLQLFIPNLIIINSWGPVYKENYVLLNIIRVYSLLDNPLTLLSFVTIIIGLLLKCKNRLYTVLLGLLYLILLLTGSRSGIVIIVISSIVILFLKNTIKEKIIILTISIFISLLVIPLNRIKRDNTVVADRMMNEKVGVIQRIYVLKSSIEMLTDNPILGIGAGNFKDVYLNGYKFEEASNEESSFTSENFFLRIYLDHGLIPFILVSYLILASLINGYRNFKYEYIGHFTLSIFLFCFAAGITDMRSAPLNMMLFIILGTQLKLLLKQEQSDALSI